MHLFISIIGAFAAIFVIIILHEMGHMYVARLFGIKILRFSIGFGKPLYKYVAKNGTEYVLAMIPLGGYVKMLGEGDTAEVNAAEMHRAFDRKPLLVRMAVVFAGPFTNFVLAVIVFWGAYQVGMNHVKPIVGRVVPGSIAAKSGLKSGDNILAVGIRKTHNWQQVVMAMLLYMGDHKKVDLKVEAVGSSQATLRQLDLSGWQLNKRKPEIFKTLGMYPFEPKVAPVILRVLPESPAALAGMKPKDKITAVNGKPVTTWGQVVKAVAGLGGKKVSLTVSSGGQARSLSVQLSQKVRGDKKVGYLGVMVVPPKYTNSMIYREKYNLLTAWMPALSKAWTLFKYNGIVLYKMITAKLSFKVIGGPISIFQAAGQASHAGIVVYLSFIGFISLAVGFINLLPIPGLDGGHLLFQIIEGLTRRPVPQRIQQYGLTLGMLVVVLVIVHATINDLVRIFA